MIRHIVMRDVRGETVDPERQNVELLRNRFKGLHGRVPRLLHLEIGVDCSAVDYGETQEP